MLMGATGVVAGGRIGFTFMPRIESDIVSAQIVLPFGSSVEETRLVEERVAEALDEVVAANGGDAIVRGVFSQLAAQSGGGRGGPGGGGTSTGSHLAEVSLYLVPMDQRDVTAADITQAWRRAVGEVAGLERLSFQFSTGPATDAPINVELAHTDIDTLEGAATRLAAQLSTYGGVTDVDDGFAEGKEQLDFQLTAEGRAAGLTEMELARQVRSAFFGAEAVRQQRGRDEVRVYVRRPEAERSSLAHLEQFIVRTPAGGEIPLGQAANIVRGRSYTQITRVNGKRVVNVTADVEREAMATEVQAALMTEVLPAIKADTPGLRFDSGGQQRRRAESLGSLGTGFQIALFVMYGLIAMAFRRYVQPLVVMTAIPFGFVGALIGHLLMGYDLSLMSMMGLVALSGVAVNDSIVLVDAINRFRRGLPLVDAVVAAGSRRFRPILLTSITTFFGLAPMIFETSVQARFLIPMALSLGFGVLFATFITLVLVPALYVIVDDTVNALGRFKRFMWPDLAEVEHAAERGSAAPRALGAHDPESPAPGE
jgi:multidrug efflux pump subunit AcrB